LRRGAGFRSFAATAVLLVTAAQGAIAEPAILRAAASLRSGPAEGRAALETLPKGAAVDIERRGRRWSLVSYEGRRGYVATSAVGDPEVLAGPAEAGARGPGDPNDPNCDRGYPYSGSAAFFRGGLTELRHSEPLGFFFGYHIDRPC